MVRGKRRIERVDPKEINDDFVVDFPLTTAQIISIEVIYNMRTVKMSQLQDITGYNYKYLTAQMADLHRNRFVERKFPTKDKDLKGSNEAYFMLDTAGSIYVSGYYEIPMKEVLWSRRDNLIKYEKLNHAFHISGIRAEIEKKARESEDKILNCVCDKHLYLDFKLDEKKLILRPDIYFKYLDTDMQKQFHYFVEVDLGTMAMSGHSSKTYSFDNKVQYYDAYKTSGEYRNRFNVFPRVLVITSTTDRAMKLLAACRTKQRAGVEFLFTSLLLWNENCTGPIFAKITDSALNSKEELKENEIEFISMFQ